ELHVRYLPGGQFAESVFNVLAAGDIVRLRLPFGDFHLRDTQAPIVFVAGGTGFAPVQSMVEDVMRRRVERPMRLYFGGRTPELLYRDALARGWAAKWPALRYVPVVSSPSAGDGWSGRTGWVHDAVIADLPTLAGHEVYACGSPAMISSAREAFERHGLAPADFFCDAFAPAMELAA
ncbi:MAG: flavin oxidoreductase, partial [Rhizobacter sp.]|nr:flavin oxidoreductase [Rhizobacter sp.]